ncbi:hypothetical protein IMG5_110940 [Ichthyophthirius multifiliis]|uniref:Uncharacterized protein n=1 Tax=Ichthyophthirius multifiliis TaxID=5932 RepID=G0QTR8_ICHMU|nr:hypothetical protein IMG5_110940 [Ichthyophthirius multifiliis]EGR31389.1 hypothetical protein IMG5_110940 [Ichthyophthirius multifiliis]|eukprot:XP_004034875.1 hypothetical protein IMG5_110940 [Ichthyophthirius multifiliis]
MTQQTQGCQMHKNSQILQRKIIPKQHMLIYGYWHPMQLLKKWVVLKLILRQDVKTLHQNLLVLKMVVYLMHLKEEVILEMFFIEWAQTIEKLLLLLEEAMRLENVTQIEVDMMGLGLMLQLYFQIYILRNYQKTLGLKKNGMDLNNTKINRKNS